MSSFTFSSISLSAVVVPALEADHPTRR